MIDPPPPPRWHQALVWALIGELDQDLGRQAQPDLATVKAVFDSARPERLPRLRALIGSRRANGQPWPLPVPPELMAGIGAAQFGAVLTELRARLGLEQPIRPVISSRALDAAERRLLDDVPPHHGS